MDKYIDLPSKDIDRLIYPPDDIQTKFGVKKVVYADFIASGTPSPLVENYITKNIYGKYSNTHSNANNGIFMKKCIQHVRDMIKKKYKIGDNYEVLFKGSGCTGAINFLTSCIDYSQYSQVHIFISCYEHFSNHLPWLELSKTIKHMHLQVIPLNDSNELDLNWFENKLEQIVKNRPHQHHQHTTLILTSVIHCSNLFGYFIPIEKIRQILDNVSLPKKQKNTPNIHKYFFCDLACSAPYVQINGNLFDAFFFSPHKFIGGIETPGVLVAKTCIFQKDHPSEPGGSCTKKTHYNEIEYSTDIETRESAGTPNIIGIIKIGLCLSITHSYQKIIDNNEKCLIQLIRHYTERFQKIYPTFNCIPYKNTAKQLSIFSFHLSNLHYNFIVVLLNDIFGIQSRGGRACNGLLSDFIKDKYGIDGFCRISFHWTMNKETVFYIFSAIEYIIQNGESYKNMYRYNKKENLFYCKTVSSCTHLLSS